MSDQGNVPSPQQGRKPSRTPSSIAWILLGASLVLSIVGVFWLRLWVPGLVLGIAAFAMGIIAARRAGKSPLYTDARVLLSVIAMVMPAVIALTTIAGGMAQSDVAPPRADLQIELRVHADGDFTVSYTEPVRAGASKATVATVEATDEFTTSFTTNLNAFQFHAGIAQNNLGPQLISCAVEVNGVVVLERTGDQRYVDCSADLQELNREHGGSN